MTRIRVLIADDEPTIRGSLRLLIDSEEDLDVVGEARDGDEAVQQALTLKPDVILMDVQMPKMTGLEATRVLCARPDGPKIIMLTMFDLDEYVYEAIRAGASGFLLKNSPPASVLSAVRAAREDTALLASEVARRLIERLAPARPNPCLDVLTGRERETLALVGQGLSNGEIAERMVVTATTARTYVNRILTKLGARDRSQLVVTAYETGLTKSRQHLGFVNPRGPR